MNDSIFRGVMKIRFAVTLVVLGLLDISKHTHLVFTLVFVIFFNSTGCPPDRCSTDPLLTFLFLFWLLVDNLPMFSLAIIGGMDSLTTFFLSIFGEVDILATFLLFPAADRTGGAVFSVVFRGCLYWKEMCLFMSSMWRSAETGGCLLC